MVACRLVDMVLGAVLEVRVDDSAAPGDCFDDLKTVDASGTREHLQFKHTQLDERPLSLTTFTNDSLRLRLDRVIGAMLASREGFGFDGSHDLFRIVLRDVVPTDTRLSSVLVPAATDPGSFAPGVRTIRLAFDSAALWAQMHRELAETARPGAFPLALVGNRLADLSRLDLDWVCDRLVVEVAAPPSSGDLTEPAEAERLLLRRVRDELGAGAFPNADRAPLDVAAAFIATARAAREGRLEVTVPEILRRARLRSDYGAVSRAHPVDESVKISRQTAVQMFADLAADQAQTGGALLAVGPPGQGKSWLCHQVLEEFERRGWLIAEHYCYLGDADHERAERVLAERVFGSLTARLAEADTKLATENRPRLAADEDNLTACVARSIELVPERRVGLVVDGLDHVSRVRASSTRAFDPSRSLAEALASLELPAGSVLIVLSQPGPHLSPLENSGAETLSVPRLDDNELRSLAARHDLVPGEPHRADTGDSLLVEQAETAEFLDALSDRSDGNALYATYLCREVLRHDQAQADAAAIVTGLPAFDGTLKSYYEHLRSSLTPDGAWVADLIALIDFSVTRSELGAIRPDVEHHIDDALGVLAPVLTERAMQGGVRIYHESFARYWCEPFQANPAPRLALLEHITDWLTRQGFYDDQRAYGHLIPLLWESGRDGEAAEMIGTDFVVRSVAAGYASSAITKNLARAIRCASRMGDWAKVARFVELARAAECYQRERYESPLVDFADVPIRLLGSEAVVERLLHDDRTAIPARAGLQMCAAVDELGGVAPWQHYLDGFDRESDSDDVMYDGDSDRTVALAYLRGWLRLEATTRHSGPDRDVSPATATAELGVAVRQDPGEPLDHSAVATDQVDWREVADFISDNRLRAYDVIEVILDTFGPNGVRQIIPLMEQPATLFLCVARHVADRQLEEDLGSARSWALEAVRHGTAAGDLHAVLSFGVDVNEVVCSWPEEAREVLMSLTHRVQESNILWEISDSWVRDTRGEGDDLPEDADLFVWLDLCTAAAHRDPLSLNAAEALIVGEGWYRCWLRFTIGLARAEAAHVEDRASLAVEAIRHLTTDLEPFSGEPRACDLLSIHPTIQQMIRRAMGLVDNERWSECIETLYNISSSITTTLQGGIGGPVPPAFVLGIAVERGTESERDAATALIHRALEEFSAGRHYSDLAEFHLLGARLALAADDWDEAQRQWLRACTMLSAYGWRKDATIYELLDPLSDLIAADEARGRACLAMVQPLCERVASHTDRKGTWYAPWQWEALLAQADPSALARTSARRLLTECNLPNQRLHDGLGKMWARWFRQVDPVIAGALRLALDGALKPEDPEALSLLGRCPRPDDAVETLLRLLLARANERPVSSGHSSGEEVDNLDERMEALNEIARAESLPEVHPCFDDGQQNQQGSSLFPSLGTAQSTASRQESPPEPFPMGAPGMAMAIRAWRKRPYQTSEIGWAVDRFANAVGYRLVELAHAGREADAEQGLRLLAQASRGFEETGVLEAIAGGLERHGLSRLATIAHSLTWTRARAHGWLNFGGETALTSLHRASQLDPALALEIVGGEIERVVNGETYGTDGVTRALIVAFTSGALTIPTGASLDLAFDYWREAFAVIASRTPRVHDWDDPDDPYPPANSTGPTETQDLDEAFALGVAASLSAGPRERKRRAFLAVQLLMSHRPVAMAAALNFALTGVTDPATLMWLLRLIETESSNRETIIEACKQQLVRLSTDRHLVVRALARRLVSQDAPALPPPEMADRALLEDTDRRLWTPDGYQDLQQAEAAKELVESVAAHRIRKAEPLLAGIGTAVCERVASATDNDRFRQQLRSQVNALDPARLRPPNAYLATHQTVEQALQLSAAGGRAACIARGVALPDPVRWEDDLADVLLDDPWLPLALEATRIPRPPFPPPPSVPTHVWNAPMAETSPDAQGVASEARNLSNGEQFTTTRLSEPDAAPIANQNWLRGWLVMAVVENRTLLPPNPSDHRELLSTRFHALELRDADDEEGLQHPPVGLGDIRLWTTEANLPFETQLPGRAAPLIGLDPRARAAEDGYSGLGVHLPLLTPSPLLMALLGLHPGERFTLSDSRGRGLVLLTWRTDYFSRGRDLAHPLVAGSAVIARADLFERLLDTDRARYWVRDFLVTDSALTSIPIER